MNWLTYHLWESIITTALSFRENNKKDETDNGVTISNYHKNTAILEPRHWQKESAPFFYNAKSRLKEIHVADFTLQISVRMNSNTTQLKNQLSLLVDVSYTAIF